MSKVRIRSAGDSFRRAGITATRDGVIVDEADLTDEQKEQLLAEPRINISPVDDEDAGGGDDKSDGKKNDKGKGKK